MAVLDEQYAFRAELVERLERDLVGPGDDHEVLEDAPLEQYKAGVLYPLSADPLEDEEVVDPDEEDESTGEPDPPVSLANRRYPSSMGLTFAVDVSRGTAIRVEMSAARYESTDDGVAAQAPDTPRRRRTGGAGRTARWRRVALSLAPIEIDVARSRSEELPLGDGLCIFVRVRPPDGDGAAAVTIALINRNVVKSGLRDGSAFFQPDLRVRGADGSAVFVERPGSLPPAGDEDLQSYRLLYRHARNFAVGHGCAATWTQDESRPDRAREVATTFVPRFELRLADSNPAVDSSRLGMRFFSQGDRADVVDALRRLVDGYERWIAETRATAAESLAGDLAAVADRHLEAASGALDRMRAGIDLVEQDAQVWQAFRLTNEVMLTQRARTEWIRAERPDVGPQADQLHRWRPFQIAFILLCIRDAVSPTSSPTRGDVDLLWFPTGGGKTEAYLGLIAFTVFLRRLRRGDAGGGVTALMRYTLRLLTLQQFERAAALIVACEAVRRRRDDLGSAPISIGLWVGRDATPLTLSDAEQALRRFATAGPPDKSNPVQIQRCPWCGHPLDQSNYWIRSDRTRMVISCRDRMCEFGDGDGLPIFLIDEDVYRYRPTLLIATVDKFAGLPWREQTASLFNLGTNESPPELIVQDELHLISGPLGTLTGLYETAVDALCTTDGVGPKVVASTATIRRAGAQARGLFNRRVHQFPPPGIDARDSYFAVEVPPDEKASRLYVGVSAPATSQTTLLVRTYAALLQGASETPGSDAVRDPYWTLVGYFNSLRVLGAATIQIRDDVGNRIALLASWSGLPARPVVHEIELTSRERSSAIPGHLKRMEVSLPDRETLDVIRATNMISVGVDVDRLGLMVVMGQPQSTSEYIQATSRVGRRHPGLVVTMLNAAKSRDRSHYESFVGFHSALYRQVEATSVTPFSPRARDRGLHAVLIALARLLNPPLRPNAAAGDFEANEAAVRRAADLIVDRARAIDPDEAEHTRRHLDRVIAIWRERSDSASLFFNQPRNPEASLLASADDIDADGFPTLWSLRDVDAESHLYLE